MEEGGEMGRRKPNPSLFSTLVDTIKGGKSGEDDEQNYGGNSENSKIYVDQHERQPHVFRENFHG